MLVKTSKTSGHLGHSFVLIFKTKEAAIEFADCKQVHKFKDSTLNVVLLSNMVARKDFTNKAKDFEDDPAYTAADDSRRIMVTTAVTSANKNYVSGKDRDLRLSETQAVSERLGSYFKETRTGQWTEIFWENSHSFLSGFVSCHQARIPQLGRADATWGMHVVTFTDHAAALLALNVTEKDKEVIYR